MKTCFIALFLSATLAQAVFVRDGLVLHYSPESIQSTTGSHVSLWANEVSDAGDLMPTHSLPVIRPGDLPAISYASYDVTEWLNDNMGADAIEKLDGDFIDGLTYTLLIRVNAWPLKNFIMLRNLYSDTPRLRRPLDLGFTAKGEIFLSGGTVSGGYAAGPVSSLQTQRWYRMTATWDKSGNLSLYLDGELVGMTAGATLPLSGKPHQRLLIETSPQTQFQADIAEILIYNRALSPEEVKENADAFSEIYSLSGKPEARAATKSAGASIETTLAVTDGGLWPTLVDASEGLYLFVFNAPGHANIPGDIGCYFKADAERTWSLQGEVGHRFSDQSSQWGQASGITFGGDLITLTREKTDVNDVGSVLPTKILLSSDRGKSWSKAGTLPEVPEGHFEYFPFGRVLRAADGTLRTFAYTGAMSGRSPNIEYSDVRMVMLTSSDDGRTFGDPIVVSGNVNEGAAVEYKPGKWLVAARSQNLPVCLRQFRSIDNGKTWTDEGEITAHGEIPGDLLQLEDGRLILAYGDRVGTRNVETGVSLKVSEDNGKTWSNSISLVTLGGDLGYPSLVQDDNGDVLVAYYATQSPDHTGYHTAIARWVPPVVD